MAILDIHRNESDDVANIIVLHIYYLFYTWVPASPHHHFVNESQTALVTDIKILHRDVKALWANISF